MKIKNKKTFWSSFSEEPLRFIIFGLLLFVTIANFDDDFRYLIQEWTPNYTILQYTSIVFLIYILFRFTFKKDGFYYCTVKYYSYTIILLYSLLAFDIISHDIISFYYLFFYTSIIIIESILLFWKNKIR